jgi:hypothetical protein
MSGGAMHSSTSPRGVDLAPQAGHPWLALLLAVLSVPGSTVAWDLPAGGLWIGLPLAVAAIVLGRRARQARPDGPGRIAATAAIVLAALALGQMVVWVLVSAVG